MRSGKTNIKETSLNKETPQPHICDEIYEIESRLIEYYG